MIQAVIFDLDGTVLDNEGIWEDVFKQIAKNNGIDPNPFESRWIHEPGIGVRNNWKKILTDESQIDILIAETHKLYAELTATQDVVVREGLLTLVEEIKASGFQTALATGSEWHAVENQLEQLDLHLAFDVTTTGDEVMAAKPDPEIYTLTVQKMGFDPKECVAIEDAISGIQSAHEAGCLSIGITSEKITDVMLKAAGADFVVDNLSEVMVILREHGDKKN